MVAREYLKQIRDIETEITQLTDEHDRIDSELHNVQGIRYDRDKIQATAEDNTVKLISYLYESGQSIMRKKLQLFKTRADIIDKISRMHNHVFSELLYKRYVEYKSMETISTEMCYSYDRTVHLHAEALKAFEMVEESNLDIQ